MSEGSEAEKWELLVQTNDPASISLLGSVLEAAQIPYTFNGRDISGLMPFASGAPGILTRGLASRIFVPASRLEEARALLEADLSDASEEPEEPEEPS